MYLNYFIVGIATAVIVAVCVLLFRKNTGKHTGGIITIVQLLVLLLFVLDLVANGISVFDPHKTTEPKWLSPILLPLLVILFLQDLKKKNGEKSK